MAWGFTSVFIRACAPGTGACRLVLSAVHPLVAFVTPQTSLSGQLLAQWQRFGLSSVACTTPGL